MSLFGSHWIEDAKYEQEYDDHSLMYRSEDNYQKEYEDHSLMYRKEDEELHKDFDSMIGSHWKNKD